MSLRRCWPLVVLLAAGLMAAGCSENNGSTGGNGGGGSGGGSVGGSGGGGTGGDGGVTCNLDGHVDEGEECDDGPDGNDDCCVNCRIIPSTCGNGVLECNEECDNGDANGDDACSTKCKVPRCGNGDVEPGEECDDGNTNSQDGCSENCEPECSRDQDCNAEALEYCKKEKQDGVENAYGFCVAIDAEKQYCTLDVHCGSVETTRCGANGCYCKLNEAKDKGVCWRIVPTCDTCEEDIDCGATSHFTRPAVCTSYHYWNEGDIKVCLPKVLPSMVCPTGLVNGEEDDSGLDMRGTCVPQAKSCPLEFCEKDEDCPPQLPVCDLSRGICIPGCYINYEQSNQTVGCPPSKPACHAMEKYLDPTFLNECATAKLYGFGKCGEACVNDSDCADKGKDADGDPFVCVAEGGVKRCRPGPITEHCVSDKECPEGSREDIYRGYCNPVTQTCVANNCRRGVDPRKGCGTSKLYEDCNPDYKCVADESSSDESYGMCTEKNCIDMGGAMVGCVGSGQFCSGETMMDMMTAKPADAPVLPTTVQPGVCYDMDVNLWCSTGCTPGDNKTCNDRGGHDRYTGRDGKDGSNPNYCWPVTQEQGVCYFGCRYQAECPSEWMCSSLNFEVGSAATEELRVPIASFKFCEEDADCGNNKCVHPKVNGKVFSDWPTYTDGEGVEHEVEDFKVCSCTTTGACAGDAVCNAGLGSRARDQMDVEVERYCTVGSKDVCGPIGTLEWWGTYRKGSSGVPHPYFNCSCGGPLAKDEAYDCPVTGPANTVMANETTRCGETARDQYYCVGGKICEPATLYDEDKKPYCGLSK